MFRPARMIASVVLVSVLAACAGQPRQTLSLDERLAHQGYRLGGPVDRVLDYRINGWNSVDSQHVIINSGPSRHYLVSLRSPCHNLATAHTIAFSKSVSSLTRFDKLLVRETGTGYLEHCLIAALHQLEKLDAS